MKFLLPLFVLAGICFPQPDPPKLTLRFYRAIVDHHRMMVFDATGNDGVGGIQIVVSSCDASEYYVYSKYQSTYTFLDGPLPISGFSGEFDTSGFGDVEIIEDNDVPTDPYTEDTCWFKETWPGSGIFTVNKITGHGMFNGDCIGAMQDYSQQERNLILQGWEYGDCNSGNG